MFQVDAFYKELFKLMRESNTLCSNVSTYFSSQIPNQFQIFRKIEWTHGISYVELKAKFEIENLQFGLESSAWIGLV